MLASRLARIYNKCNDEQRNKFTELATIDMKELSSAIFTALDQQLLPPFEDINQPNNERKGLVGGIINHPEARQYLLILNAGFVEILMPGEDTLISKGFSVEDAKALLKSIAMSIVMTLRHCESSGTMKVNRLHTQY